MGRYNGRGRGGRGRGGGRGDCQQHGRSKSRSRYEDKKKSGNREIKFALPSNDPKRYVPTFATVTDAVVQQVQKTLKHGQDMANSIRDLRGFQQTGSKACAGIKSRD